MEAFWKNFLIYLVGIIVLSILAGVLAVMIHPLVGVLGNIAILALHLWFVYYVYNDAKSIGVSENWWLAIFFLGFIGALIYYFVTKDKRK